MLPLSLLDTGITGVISAYAYDVQLETEFVCFVIYATSILPKKWQSNSALRGVFWVFYCIYGNAFMVHTWYLIGGGPDSGCGMALWQFFPQVCVSPSTPAKWTPLVSECGG